MQSPRPLREGATMPVERFFAGGNVAMSPNPQHTVYPGSNTSGAPTISKFITLSPNKLSRIANASTPGGDTSSPHTISSNSVSANSSSSSETKKPLKFEIREQGGRGRGEQQSFEVRLCGRRSWRAWWRNFCHCIFVDQTTHIQGGPASTAESSAANDPTTTPKST